MVYAGSLTSVILPATRLMLGASTCSVPLLGGRHVASQASLAVEREAPRCVGRGGEGCCPESAMLWPSRMVPGRAEWHALMAILSDSSRVLEHRQGLAPVTVGSSQVGTCLLVVLPGLLPQMPPTPLQISRKPTWQPVPPFNLRITPFCFCHQPRHVGYWFSSRH